MLLKTEIEGLVKDQESGALLNVNHSKLESYKKQKKFMEERARDSYRIQKVENDLSEIKNMLQELLRDRK